MLSNTPVLIGAIIILMLSKNSKKWLYFTNLRRRISLNLRKFTEHYTIAVKSTQINHNQHKLTEIYTNPRLNIRYNRSLVQKD